MPEIYVIGGCNGSGKTTFALNIFPNIGDIEFINADLIAAELNPNNPERVVIQASRIMLKQIKALARQNADFAFETTLAARTLAPFLRQCQAKGYLVNLIYVWLNSVELAITRVAMRVASGGHNIPEDVIRRRYNRGRKNFLELYSRLADRWQVYDNSSNNQLIAFSNNKNQTIDIVKTDTWNKIEFSNTNKMSQLFQQAVDKAIENHRQKGESIAIADAEGKVKIIPAAEIPQLQKVKLSNS